MVQRDNEPVWYCIDTQGNVLFSYECSAAGTFSDGLAMVQVGDAAAPDFGFIDQEGMLVIPAIYKNALDFSYGRAPVANGEKVGVIDKAGNAVTDFLFTSVQGSYFEGKLAVQNENSKWGFIDINGEQIVPFEYDSVQVFVDGLARVQKNGKFGYVDHSGALIIPCEYDSAAYGEGYFTLLKDGEITVMNRTELQPTYIEDDAAYLDALAKQLEDEEAKIAEAREAQKMLTEYTDKETIKAAQTALNEAGYDCGTPDGIAGKGTAGAVTNYQTDKGLNITGTITHELLIALGVIAE